MDREALLKTISDTIQSLQYKINFIANIHDDGNEKIKAVKKKTIDVLNSVAGKISGSRNDLELHELEKGLQNINIKSLQLYENALNKIYELKQEMQHSNLTYETISGFSNDIDKASNEIRGMRIEPDDQVSLQAISILRGWLIQEGDEK